MINSLLFKSIEIKLEHSEKYLNIQQIEWKFYLKAYFLEETEDKTNSHYGRNNKSLI